MSAPTRTGRCKKITYHIKVLDVFLAPYFLVFANFLAAFAARQRAFPPPTPPPLAFLCRGVDVYMTKLRQKLSDCESFEIKTVHGLGYKAVIK